MGEYKFIPVIQVTLPILPPYPYMVKTLKIYFSGMPLWLLECYQIYLNDDPELTLTYFTAVSNLVPFVVVWENT